MPNCPGFLGHQAFVLKPSTPGLTGRLGHPWKHPETRQVAEGTGSILICHRDAHTILDAELFKKGLPDASDDSVRVPTAPDLASPWAPGPSVGRWSPAQPEPVRPHSDSSRQALCSPSGAGTQRGPSGCLGPGGSRKPPGVWGPGREKGTHWAHSQILTPSRCRGPGP